LTNYFLKVQRTDALVAQKRAVRCTYPDALEIHFCVSPIEKRKMAYVAMGYVG
jgi:hypothetical protein